ncbi:MAG TPA: PAS domain S-box protein [Hyphomonadaceae bacterium]|nr:PAS domain S-box protein [Hyphomonadaceae bacterium]
MRDADAEIIALAQKAAENERSQLALRESEQRLAQEAAGARTLQAISTRLISEVTQESLVEQILDAAMELMGADASRLQMLTADGKSLTLLGWKNFPPAAGACWREVAADAGCTCGTALRRRERIVVGDTEACDFLKDTQELAEYRRSGIRAFQITPLFSRTGRLLGLISTHWANPHTPADSWLRTFDVLARQAADIIERTRAETALRESEERQAYLLKLADALRPLADPVQIQEAACRILGSHLRIEWAQYVEINVERWTASVARDFFRGDSPSHVDLPSHVGEYDLGIYPEHAKAWCAGQTLAIADIATDQSLSEGERTGLLIYSVRAMITTPLMRNGEPVAAMAALSSTPRRWTDVEIALLQETADRTWEAVERARAEAALRTSEAKYRSLFENMDEAFYLLEVVRDEEGRPTDVVYLDQNAAGIRMAGSPVAGKRLSGVNTNSLPEWLPVFDGVARTGKPERFEKFSTVTGHWQHYHVFPAGSGEDRVGILAYNISSRKLAEEQLRESEAKFRAIANTSPVIIWMSDENSKVAFVNQSWLDFTGQSLEEALGDGWSQPIHPEDVLLMQPIYERALERREVFNVDFRLRRADGEYRSFVSTCAPRFHNDGSFAGYAGCSIDVTERRQAEEALASFNQQLADAQENERARIARELHDDVVQRLVGLGLQLGNAGRSLPAHEEAFGEIQNARSAVLSLARDAQTLSQRLHPTWLEILGIAGAARGLCREVSRHSGVEIEWHIEDAANGLADDAALCLYRVLQEALQNAIKHSRAARVEVSLRAMDAEVEMVVKDFGGGIAPAAARFPALGLTSMKERLNTVGGRLSVRSQQGGTTIRACVPITGVAPGAVGEV